MNKNLQAILDFVQQSEQLNDDEKKSILKSLKDANKEIEITAFKLDRTEKVKRTTAILLEETIEELEQKRKAVEAQNKELEIETSLERVRTVAMGMRKAGDLLDICQALFAELRTLGFNELRNAMINIFNKDSISFLNYDYSDNAGKTITSHYYDSHPLIEKQVNEVKSSRDAFSETVFSGKDLEEWRAFRKEKGEKDDPKLDTITALFYYFYAIGTGAIGISTYSSISGEKLNVLKRFRNVFDLAYRRFIDIENAEAQARESQVQLALERVRARTMAMQHSDELKEAAALLFQQAKVLGVPAYSCGYNIWEKDDKVFTSWMSTQDGSIINGVPDIPLTEDANFIRYVESKEKGEPFFVLELRGERMQEHYQYLKTIPAFKGYFDYTVSVGFDLPKTQIHYLANFSHGNLLFISLDLCPEFHDVFKRFAAVFEQTYTRFLDLQKAEAQAREAEIQLALERVRARTMAMQKQNDLLGVLDLLVEQLVKLGVNLQVANFSNGIPGGDWDLWIEVAADDGTIFNNYVHFPRIEHPYFHQVEKNIETYRKDGTNLFKDVFSKDEKDSWQDYINTQTIYKDLTPEDIRQSMYEKPGYIWSMVILKDSWVSICRFNTIPFSDEEDALLGRFANAFGQTYTRFLDLQNAEAQAREAQIQLSLERVRARTMAMQHSNELAETASILFQQIKNLGFETWSCGFCIWKDDTIAEAWMGADSGGLLPPLMLPYKEEQTHHEIYKVYLQGMQSYDHVWEGRELENHYTFLKTIPSVKEAIDLMEKSGLVLPQRQCYYVGFFKKGYLLLITKERNEELKELSQRLAQVFDLTYTRFLDLQKAEAQAREAQIEVALERLRSRTMAMHRSDELLDTSQLFFQQIRELGETVVQASIAIVNEETGFVELSSSIHGSQLPYTLKVPIDDPFLMAKGVAAWKAKQKSLTLHFSGQELTNYNELRNSFLEKKVNYPEDQWIVNLSFFSKGWFSFSSNKHESPEIIGVLKRFAAVFEQTYTRFLDLQKSEQQAREAKIETALEKVRSRTLAMQKSEELAETATVLFQQLIALGTEPNRLYIAVIKNEAGSSEFWITDEDGTKISTAFSSNLHDNFSFSKMFDGWKQQRKSLVIDMQGEELKNYFEHLHSLGVPFKDGLAQQRRVQDIAYFSHGFIGIASPDEQPAENLLLLERFAAVFNLTFTRFNDLKLAEAHAIQAEEDLIKLQTEKKRAEDALTELRAAQKQLIQSEKMASLGELTAGIAHEIQNPLNFVNNFSEVSKELLDEMSEALAKGNAEEAREIINDVIQNLEKINHHGKRADGIVKGMLQHSRSTGNDKVPTDINALADEYLRLSYHGLRAKDKNFNATLKTDYDENIGKINIVAQDIGRVILNLVTNAFYAVNEKAARFKLRAAGYEPTVSISTRRSGNQVEIRVADNGSGIPQNIVDKIFQPFFTTKPTGQGTGLGLSLAYDIVKAIGGELKVETRSAEAAAQVGKEFEGTTFIIQLPFSNA